MSKTRTELLEKAVLDLTVENTGLKIELETAKKEADRNWKWYSTENAKLKVLEYENEKILKGLAELEGELETIRGAEVKEMCEVKDEKFSIETEETHSDI